MRLVLQFNHSSHDQTPSFSSILSVLVFVLVPVTSRVQNGCCSSGCHSRKKVCIEDNGKDYLGWYSKNYLKWCSPFNDSPFSQKLPPPQTSLLISLA